jgi:hypothetical protein
MADGADFSEALDRGEPDRPGPERSEARANQRKRTSESEPAKEVTHMGRVIGVLLILAGVVALVYGGFDMNREEHSVGMGSTRITVTDTKHVPVPPLVGALAIGAGLVLFLTSLPRTRASS